LSTFDQDSGPLTERRRVPGTLEFLAFDQVTPANLRVLAALGLEYVQVDLPDRFASGVDRTEDLKRLRGLVEDHGLRLYAADWWIPSADVVYGRHDRDGEIEDWCRLLEAMGGAGIPARTIMYSAGGRFRTSGVPGRGGSIYDTWDREAYSLLPRQQPEPRIFHGSEPRDPRQFPLRPVPRDSEIAEPDLWANLVYLLERVVPVAEAAGVRIAIHPEDPPTSEPLGGAARILVSSDAFARVFGELDSPALGILFCQECFAEMGRDLHEAIRRFADRIVFVHFRAVRGSGDRFHEVFVDEGDLDLARVMETYRDAGVTGPFSYDHTPGFPHEAGDWIGRAFATGYIRGLLDTVYGRGAPA
jgi:mannonate dehydratase